MSPYLLIPISISLLLLYLLSGLLVRLNLLNRLVNRKIWNSALLVTFLATACLGILLVIQTNYKLEWPLVKKLLKWHVDFGLALSFIAIFHLLRHFKYYLRIFMPENEVEISSDSPPENDVPLTVSSLKSLILLSGFLATSIQVLLIREITTVFQGNELMMSWTLGAWMLLTGVGSFWGRSMKNSEKAAAIADKILLLLAFLPVLLVPLLDILKTSIFPPGIMVSPAYFLLILFLFLAPICLLSGFIYSMLIHAFRFEDNGFTRVYALEATGSLFGGLVVSFAFVQWFTVIQSLLILLLMATILRAFIRKEAKSYIAVAAALVVVVFSGPSQPDRRLKSFLFVNQKVLTSKETWHGNVTITENAGQFNFYGNGSLLYTTDNTITSEEYTHYAMMQHENPKDVLLVSGGIAGMMAEILKYKSVENVDYVELNPELIGLSSKYSPLPSDSRVHLIFGDGRRVIQRSNKKYDVVILAVPDPSSLQINRFYTDEFMTILKRKLNPGGVVLYGLSSSGNYMSAEKKEIGASFYQTLKNNFPRTEIIPGERDYFIASDSALRTDMARLSAEKAIETKYVNSYYIDDNSIRQRGQLIRENLQGKMMNRDDKPLPVYFHTLQFISKYTSKGWIFILIPVIILLIPLFFMRSVASGMYISGFTASAFEILIIFTFQTFFGYVYSAIGLIIAIFMGGLAIGSIFAGRFIAVKRQFVAAQLLLVLYSLLFPLFWILQRSMENSFAGLLLFGLVTLLLSAVTGFQYVIGTKILPGAFTGTAPLLYAVDLVGAALGTIILSVILLPLAGVVNSCLILAGINLLIALYIAVRKN